ncbi:peptide-methionine (R)-S-oxide reductase MsrB [Sphingobium mellinum]|uniref:peptide-methionine (R)-S-oxide reductase MsrB n=1 Tax=Sphingobium mellinum TaxID=1387166 RepID=UPI0030EF23D5
MTRRHLLTGALCGIAAAALWHWGAGEAEAAYPFELSDQEWRRRLSPLAYRILRHAATEQPFTSPLNTEHRKGVFSCAGCGQPLFGSATKFDSGTGWPSFWKPLARAVGTSRDFTLGYPRTEVHCARCGGHLGHVFDDGPPPTGKRYCMNGAALSFAPV